MPWQPTIEAAQQIAARTNRLVLIHFWKNACQPCARLDSEVFSHPEVARELETQFVMVKLNAEQAEGTARMYGVSSVPTDVITLPNGQLVSQVISPPKPRQYVAQLKQVVAGHRSLAQRSQARAVAPPAAAIAGVAAPPQAAPPQAAPPAAHPNDRYSEYFPQHQGAGMAAPPAGYPANTASQAPAAAPPQMAGSQFAPPIAGQAPIQQATAPFVAQAAAAVPASYPSQMPRPPQLPPGSPPMALDGYCSVTLVDRQQWTMGDARFGAIHRGHTYLFLGPTEVKNFLADPDKYAPVLGGNDPVLALDNQQMVPGRREFGVYLDNRVYLFANEGSRRNFEQNPQRYSANAMQAAGAQPVVR